MRKKNKKISSCVEPYIKEIDIKGETKYEIIKAKVEALLFQIGFKPVIVKQGLHEYNCYKHDELYCQITFWRWRYASGEINEFVVIEYANWPYEGFEDGDMIPVDIPVEQIISYIEAEVLNAINQESTKTKT